MATIVSLFSGAGGLSYGFKRAGYTPTVAVEIDAKAAKTYENNIGLKPLQLDIASPETIEVILQQLESRPVTAVIGGPPCQGFSTAGGRIKDDPRNLLIFRYLNIVERLNPTWFLFENVEGLLTSEKGNSVSELVRSFIDLGYSLRLEKVNFASYGLPQARKRVLLVGNRIGRKFRLPQPTHSYNAGKHRLISNLPLSPSVRDALAGLGEATKNKEDRVFYTSAESLTNYDSIMRDDKTDVTMHHYNISPFDEQRYRQLGPGQTMRDLPEAFQHVSFTKRANRRVSDGTPSERRGGAPSGFKRLRSDFNSLTITSAATRELIHPDRHRPLTLREAARLQSFPDSFEFFGNNADKIRQIGNAFPPLVAEIFARNIMSYDIEEAREIPAGLIGFGLTTADAMSPTLRLTHASLAKMQDEMLQTMLDVRQPWL